MMWWHMYDYNDGVDIDDDCLRQAEKSGLVCPECHGLLSSVCPEIVSLQKISRRLDMTSVGCLDVGVASIRLLNLLKEFSSSLHFGRVYKKGTNPDEATHCIFTFEEARVAFHGTLPVIRDGKPVPEDGPGFRRRCGTCNLQMNCAQGDKFLYKDEVPKSGHLFGTTYCGFLFDDMVHAKLAEHKLRGVYMEKISIEPRSTKSMSY